MVYPTLIVRPSSQPDQGNYRNYVAWIQRHIDTLPNYVHRLAGYHNARVQVAYTRDDLSPDRRAHIHDQIIRNGRQVNDPGAANYMDGTFHLALVARLNAIENGQKRPGEWQNPGIVNHEIGHMLADMFGAGTHESGVQRARYSPGSSKSLADLKLFRGALRADHRKNGEEISDKAVNETLANGFWALANWKNNQNPEHLPEHMRRFAQEYPNTLRAWKIFDAGMAAISQRYPNDPDFRAAIANYAGYLDGKGSSPVPSPNPYQIASSSQGSSPQGLNPLQQASNPRGQNPFQPDQFPNPSPSQNQRQVQWVPYA